MIEVLRDQLAQLLPGVLTKRFGRLQALAQGPLAYQGYLVPEHKSVPVREVVNGLAMLVMSEAYAGDSHLTHRCLVCGNVLRFRGPALAFAILVIADAMHGHVFSVQEQPVVRIEPDLPDAKGERDAIHKLGGLV